MKQNKDNDWKRKWLLKIYETKSFDFIIIKAVFESIADHFPLSDIYNKKKNHYLNVKIGITSEKETKYDEFLIWRKYPSYLLCDLDTIIYENIIYINFFLKKFIVCRKVEEIYFGNWYNMFSLPFFGLRYITLNIRMFLLPVMKYQQVLQKW